MILRIKYAVALVLCTAMGLKARSSGGFTNPATLKITVFISDAKETDTVALRMYSSFYTIEKKIMYAEPGKDKGFTFQVTADESFGYWEITRLVAVPANDTVHSMPGRFVGLTPTYYWEKGDDIRIDLKRKKASQDLFTEADDYDIWFTGKGASKYTVRYKAARFVNWVDAAPLFDEAFHYHNPYSDSYSKICKILDSSKASLSESAYNVLKAEFAFSNGDLFYQFGGFTKKATDNGTVNDFYNAVKGQLYTILHPVSDIPNRYLARSKEVCRYIINGLGQIAMMEGGKYNLLGLGKDSIYYYIKRNYTGELRDNLISYYLYVSRPSANVKQVFEDALQTVKAPRLLQKLQSMSYTQMPGSKACNFSLPDSAGQLHSLSDLAGKTVFIDFWFTGCGACEYFYKLTLSQVEERYRENKNIVFVTISIDLKDYLWKRSLRSGKYTGPGCINLYTGGNGDQVPLIEHYQIGGYPTAILIDRSGKIIRYNTLELYDKESLINAINGALK